MAREPGGDREALLSSCRIPRVCVITGGRFGLKRLGTRRAGFLWLLTFRGTGEAQEPTACPRWPGRGRRRGVGESCQQTGGGAAAGGAVRWQLLSGRCCSSSSGAVSSASHRPCPLSESRTSAPWGPNCCLSATREPVAGGSACSQTKARPLPGPIKPPACPASQPPLSLGSPISPDASLTRCSLRCPEVFLTLQGPWTPSGERRGDPRVAEAPW